MSVSTAIARRIAKPRAKDTKRLKDESYIDVEAREVKDLPRLGDKTIRGDVRKTDTPKRGRGRTAAVAGTVGTAGAIAAFSGKEDKGTKETKVTSAKAAPAKSETPIRGFDTPKSSAATPAKSTRSAGGKEFDAKFAEMRRAGKDTFTWRGKSYSTKQAGETAEQHKAKMEKIRDKTEKEMQRITTMYKGGMSKTKKK